MPTNDVQVPIKVNFSTYIFERCTEEHNAHEDCSGVETTRYYDHTNTYDAHTVDVNVCSCECHK